jgi:hypothetical protein
MRTSIRAALVLTLALAITPSYGATRSAGGTKSQASPGPDNPIVRALRSIKRVIVHVLEQPGVPIPGTQG